MCSRDIFSEMQDKFKPPQIQKPKATRAKRLEQFLWQELFDEYIRYNDRLRDEAVVPEPPTTEYFDEFCKNSPVEDQVAKEELTHRFPLYSSTAITVHNPTGDITRDFKRRYSITRPVSENTEQFG